MLREKNVCFVRDRFVLVALFNTSFMDVPKDFHAIIHACSVLQNASNAASPPKELASSAENPTATNGGSEILVASSGSIEKESYASINARNIRVETLFEPQHLFRVLSVDTDVLQKLSQQRRSGRLVNFKERGGRIC